MKQCFLMILNNVCQCPLKIDRAKQDVILLLERSLSQTKGKNLWAWGSVFFRRGRRMCVPIQLPATSCQHMDGYFRFVLAATRCATLATEDTWKYIPETNLSYTNILSYLSSAPTTTHRKWQIHWKNKLTLGCLWTPRFYGICKMSFFFKLHKVRRRSYRRTVVKTISREWEFNCLAIKKRILALWIKIYVISIWFRNSSEIIFDSRNIKKNSRPDVPIWSSYEVN